MASNKSNYLRKAMKFGLGAVAALALAMPAVAQTGSGGGSGTATGVGSGGGNTTIVPGRIRGGVPGGIQGGVPGGIGGGAPGGIQGGVPGGGPVGALTYAQGGAPGGIQGGVPGGALTFAYAGIPGGLFGGVDGEFGFRSAFSLFDEQFQDRNDREDELYSQGSDALNEGKWDRAVDRFDLVAQIKGKRADAAHYWKAWAQNKLGQRTEALATLAAMQKEFPQSRWLNDAKILEIEVRQKAGQPVSVESQTDCETKLLALNGLAQADAGRAVPILEKMLHSPDCIKLRRQSLFVLAQMNSQEAHDLLVKLAQGVDANPGLQANAIQTVGQMGGSWGREALANIYAKSNDLDTKKNILRALMMSGDRERIHKAAQTEKDPELRKEAIRLLGQMGAREEIWQLYQTETAVDVKKVVMQSMFQSGDGARVAQIATKEQDHSLRMSAISYLGMMGAKPGSKNEEALLSIYGSDTDTDVRKKVVGALFMSGNAHGLVALARKETDPQLRKTIVSSLAMMHDKEATDYMLELLNK
jgi:HEAT repeat protein